MKVTAKETINVGTKLMVFIGGLSLAFSAFSFTESNTTLENELSVTPAILTETWAVNWWLPRHKDKIALAKKGGIDLLLIGDSITHGWESVGSQIWQDYFTDIKTLNLGFSGDRTENVLWRLQQDEIKGVTPKLTVLMIGTNNTGHRLDSPEAIAHGVKAILDELQQRIPESKVLMLAIFPRGGSPSNKLRLNNNKTNTLLEALAKQHKVLFADINEHFLTEKGVLLPSVMPDLLHPNEVGYKIWAEALTPFVEKYVN